MRTKYSVLALVPALALMACSEAPTDVSDAYGAPQAVLTGSASVKTTLIANLTPELGAGNFVSSDDYQLCYDIFPGAEQDFHGFKIDSNSAFSNANITTTISGGKELRWDADNATIWAIIMKGGSNYNLYDYHTPRYSQGTPAGAWDGTFDYWLTSPPLRYRNGVPQFPEISHYNFCYTIDVPDNGGNGCTPGYWRNHYDRWFGYTHDQVFDAVFGVTFLGGVTLGQAISAPQTYGTFAFHAVAALLNSTGGVPNADPPDGDGASVEYAFTTAQVIAMVQAAVLAGDTQGPIQDLKDANEAGCPLGGTRAVPVP